MRRFVTVGLMTFLAYYFGMFSASAMENRYQKLQLVSTHGSYFKYGTDDFQGNKSETYLTDWAKRNSNRIVKIEGKFCIGDKRVISDRARLLELAKSRIVKVQRIFEESGFKFESLEVSVNQKIQKNRDCALEVFGLLPQKTVTF